MLTFGLSVTAGGGRVAGLRTGREGRTGGEAPGCCPPEEESEEVLLEGGDLQEEWGFTTGEDGVEWGSQPGKKERWSCPPRLPTDRRETVREDPAGLPPVVQ